MIHGSEYKAIFLDLNDTVVGSRPDDRPSQRVMDSAARVRNAGIKLMAATGLPAKFAQPTFEALGIRNYCLVNGGAEIYSPGMRLVVAHTSLNIQEQPAVANVFERCNELNIPVFGSATQYGLGDPITDAESLDASNTKLFLEAVDTNLSKTLIDEFRELDDITAYSSPSWRHAGKDIHITDSTATKANVDHILELYHINRSETVVVGDSELDMPMLTLEGIGLVAVVANAPKNIKRTVKRLGGIVVPSMENDGVAALLDQIVDGRITGQKAGKPRLTHASAATLL